jgi:hypothetical protein
MISLLIWHEIPELVGQIANLRPIGNRPLHFRFDGQADYQSAAGYQPAPQREKKT